MEQSVIVVDGAYGDPEAARRAALSLAFGDATRAFGYRGRSSPVPPTRDELRCVTRAIASDQSAVDGSGSSGAFHLSMAGDGDALEVHAHDPDRYRWMGIIDLTPSVDEPGAIRLYRHVETGSEGRSSETVHAARNRRAMADGADPDRWECVMSASTAFNRLVLFRPWLWHSVPAPRGAAAHDARLLRILMIEGPADAHAEGPATGLSAG